MIKLLKRIINNEVFRYLFAGGCTTLLNVGLFGFLCYSTKIGTSEAGIMFANIISIVAAILFAFGINKLFVFRSHRDSNKAVLWEMFLFCSARATTMAVEVGGVYLLVIILGISPVIGKLITQIIVIIGNYIISKRLVFACSSKK